MSVGPVPLYNWQVTVTTENGDPFPAVTVSPSSGLSITNTSPSNEQELLFSADASGLAVGYYNVKAVVNASNLDPRYSPFVIPVTLRVSQPVAGAGIKRLELGTINVVYTLLALDKNLFVPFSQTPAWLPTYKVLAQAPEDGIPKAVRVTYDLPGNEPRTLILVLMEQNNQGKWTRKSRSRGVTADPGTGQSVIELLPSSYVIAAGTTKLGLGVVLERDGRTPFYSQPIEVPIADVRVVHRNQPDFVIPDQEVVYDFDISASNPTTTPFVISVRLRTDTDEGSSGYSALGEVLPGTNLTAHGQYPATAMRWVGAEWQIGRGMGMSFDFGTRVPLWSIKASPVSTAIDLPASLTAQNTKAFLADLSVITSAPLDTTCTFQPQSLPSLLPPGAPLRNSPGLTALDLAWQVSPSIPENGTLQGVLTLDYSRAPLPNFPGFVETNLQVVSCDESGTGQLRTYPTVIDPVAHTASVFIHGLAPLYSVAIVSPSGSGPEILPMLSGSSDIRTRLAWVNLAGGPVEVLERAYEHDGYLYQESGITNPATRLLAPGQQVTAQAQDLFGLGWLPWDGWIEAYPTASGSLAFELLEASGDVELIPAACASACDLVLPGLTLDGSTTTQLEILNPANVGREVELQLRGESAQPLAVRKHWLNPKSKLASTVPDLFPETTLTGNAHLFLQTDGPLTALAILRSPGAISVVDAQPFRSEPGPTSSTCRFSGAPATPPTQRPLRFSTPAPMLRPFRSPPGHPPAPWSRRRWPYPFLLATRPTSTWRSSVIRLPISRSRPSAVRSPVMPASIVPVRLTPQSQSWHSHPRRQRTGCARCSPAAAKPTGSRRSLSTTPAPSRPKLSSSVTLPRAGSSGRSISPCRLAPHQPKSCATSSPPQTRPPRLTSPLPPKSPWSLRRSPVRPTAPRSPSCPHGPSRRPNPSSRFDPSTARSS